MPCRSGWHDLNSGSLIGLLVRQPMPERATTADLQPPEASPALEVNLNAAGGTEPNFDHHSDNHVCQKMYRSLASRRLLSRVLECFQTDFIRAGELEGHDSAQSINGGQHRLHAGPSTCK